MNKFILGILIGLMFCLLTSITKPKSSTFKGKYRWESAMEMNHLLLVKSSPNTEPTRFSNTIEFKGNKFTDNRRPSCGNDVSYSKTGTFSIVKNNLILNYTGGEFHDNVGGDSMQVYVKTKVYYQIINYRKDTIELIWKKGKTFKNSLRPKK